MEPFTLDGQVYGIPKDFNTLAVFYNEDLFDEAGVDYPNAEDTWESFAEKLRGVSELGATTSRARVSSLTSPAWDPSPLPKAGRRSRRTAPRACKTALL